MNMKRLITFTLLVLLLLVLSPPVGVAKGAGGGPPPGKGEDTAGNNLSFPVITADGFAITPLTTPTFTVPYTGSYTGLTAEEIAYLEANGPWYAQKVDGNKWQAAYTAASGSAVVTGVDWGDVIESVYPKIGRPFRLEVTLYQQLAVPMEGYTIALLANPSSKDEIQGTNATRYASRYATIVSSSPRLVIQNTTNLDLATLSWDGAKWIAADGTIPAITPISFGTELNVGGKYIYGASVGGWKPMAVGSYRITFYLPSSQIRLASAVVGNFVDGAFVPTTPLVTIQEEGAATFPVVRGDLNVTYVDTQVVSGSNR